MFWMFLKQNRGFFFCLIDLIDRLIISSGITVNGSSLYLGLLVKQSMKKTNIYFLVLVHFHKMP